MKNIVVNRMTKKDWKDIWQWRNHPEVRKNFFNTERVPWQEHKKWAASKAQDSNTKIYVAWQDKEKVGVVRFAIENASVKVSVNLNPRFFGKGLGAEIIKAGTEKILSEMNSIKSIIAEIKKDNIASQKAFSKAGYTYIEETEEKIVYKREVSPI